MRDEVITGAVEEIGRVVLQAFVRGEPPTADALRFLLRGYAATGRDDFREALEDGLARALEIAVDSSSAAAPRWLILFVEAADASDDERLRHAASNLASKARMNWSVSSPALAIAASSVDAYIRAVPLLEGGTSLLQAPIDELERIVSTTYEPGEGITGTLDDELCVAGLLLTAFAVTDRLPYAMLAEELLQHGRQTLMTSDAVSFATQCEAASVLSRMARLHQADDYRAAAVIAPDADYTRDAGFILERLAPDARTQGLAAAAYALAAGELQSAF